MPAGETVEGQVSNIDFAPTLLDVADAEAGRRMDGVSLLPTIRDHERLPRPRPRDRGAARRCSAAPIPVNGWDRPYKGVRTDRYTYVVWTETGEEELYDRRRGPVRARRTWPPIPPTPTIKADLAGKLAKLDDCRGNACNVKP